MIDLVAAVRRADSRIVPSAGLPAAARASGGSRPWSTALRTRCRSGSSSASTSSLSSSVSSPASSRRARLPSASAEVAHGAVVLAEDAADRDHAQPHHLLAQLAGDRVEPVGAVSSSSAMSPSTRSTRPTAPRAERCGPWRHRARAAARRARRPAPATRRASVAIGRELGGRPTTSAPTAVRRLVAAEHQLADQVEQPIELVEVDPDRLRAPPDRPRPAARPALGGGPVGAGARRPARRPRPRPGCAAARPAGVGIDRRSARAARAWRQRCRAARRARRAARR